MFYCVHTNIVRITKLDVRVEAQMAQQRVQQPEATSTGGIKRGKLSLKKATKDRTKLSLDIVGV